MPCEKILSCGAGPGRPGRHVGAGRISAWFGGEGSMILVRPDAVIATVSRIAVDLQDWIESQLGQDQGMNS